MGDRALIQFVDSDADFSPVVYLHWNGTEAEQWIRECAALMAGRPDDVAYTAARFVGLCHNHIDGIHSLGMWNADAILTEADSHGDAGVFIVECFGDWAVTTGGGYAGPFKAAEAAK